MLLTSFRSRMSEFTSLRLSNMDLSHRCEEKDDLERLVMANYEVDGMTTARTEVPASIQRKERALEASGIRWRYAEQGMGLHRVAYIDKEDPAFSRKSYIDGVAYVLMALPEDLSDREVASIREALPPSMSDLDLVDEADGRAIGWKSAPGSRTVLQRCVAITVALSVVFIHTILSYASIVVSVGAYYERKHNISEQILSKGFVIASAVGRHSVFLSAKICAMKDGPVGKAISNMATRTVESVASGIQEGIGQGLMMSDTRPGRR